VAAGIAVTSYKDLGYSGAWHDYEWSSVVALARFNPDGSLDGSFGYGGKVTATATGANCPTDDPDGNTTLQLQADGRILVTPSFTNSVFPYVTFRFMPDGTADTSYGTAGVAILAALPDGANRTPAVTFAPLFVWTALQPDGRLLQAKFTMQGQLPNETFALSLVRFNPDGSLDRSFGSGGELDVPAGTTFASGGGLFVQADGRIVASWPEAGSVRAPMIGYTDGTQQEYTSVATGAFGIQRFNPDGSPDGSFHGGAPEVFAIAGPGTYIGNRYSAVTENWQGIAEQSDGKLIVGTSRLNPDGSPDPAYVGDPFGLGCRSSLVLSHEAAVLPNGQILMSGERLQRINADGTPDHAFGLNGFATVHPLPSGPTSSGVVPPSFAASSSALPLSSANPNDPANDLKINGITLAHNLENFAAINAQAAWHVQTDCRRVPIAVLDDGVDVTHPDLAPNLLPGWNFVAGNGNIAPDGNDWNQTDPTTHEGTMLAGIVGAVGGNSRGVTGICWQASIFPYKVLSRSKTGYLEDTIAAIRQAVDQGARIILIAWSVQYYEQAFHDAIAYAASKDVLVVTGGGRFYPINPDNIDPSLIDPRPVANYPADFGLPNVVTVMAMDASNQAPDSRYRDYGGGSVDVAAPSQNQPISTFPTSFGWSDCPGTGEWGSDGNYTPAFQSGYCVDHAIFDSNVRLAPAYVAGAAALAWSRNPSLSVAQLRSRIQGTAAVVGSVHRLDVKALLGL
jgi:uncharacterized delta-60 repeat protein